MKKITQKQIAKFLGLSESFLSEIIGGTKGFSKMKAKHISEQTGISFEDLMFSDGNSLYKKFLFSYSQQEGN